MPKNLGKALNPIASLADPELRKAAERFARAIPEDSVLRTEGAERLFGGIKGHIEEWAHDLNPTPRMAVEKIIDFFDFASVHLADGGDTSVSGIAANWVGKFLADAPERIKNADDPTAEAERIHEEFLACKLIADTLSDELGFDDRPKEVDINQIDWKAKREQIDQTLDGVGKKVAPFLGRLDNYLTKKGY